MKRSNWTIKVISLLIFLQDFHKLVTFKLFWEHKDSKKLVSFANYLYKNEEEL